MLLVPAALRVSLVATPQVLVRTPKHADWNAQLLLVTLGQIVLETREHQQQALLQSGLAGRHDVRKLSRRRLRNDANVADEGLHELALVPPLGPFSLAVVTLDQGTCEGQQQPGTLAKLGQRVRQSANPQIVGQCELGQTGPQASQRRSAVLADWHLLRHVDSAAVRQERKHLAVQKPEATGDRVWHRRSTQLR